MAGRGSEEWLCCGRAELDEQVDELTTADLGTLVVWIESDDASVGQLSPQQWLAAVELVTGRLTDVADGAGGNWLRLSNAYFRYLSFAEKSGIIDELDATIRSLNLTSVLLGKVGSRESISLLSPVAALSSFLAQVPVSLPEARELSENWRTIDISDVRLLRVVKNLLTPASSLKPFVGDGWMRSALCDWEAIYPKLP